MNVILHNNVQSLTYLYWSIDVQPSSHCEFESRSWRVAPETTLGDKVCQSLVFSGYTGSLHK